MCFSASASFTASALLATVGTVLVVRAKTKRLLPLLLIPWFFALQQFAEGFVWLCFPSSCPLAKDAFLVFAYVFWPIWVPFSLWRCETHSRRKSILAICFGMGISLALFLCLLIPEMRAEPYRCSIQYTSALPIEPRFHIPAAILYLIATLLPLFVSSLKKIWLLGILIAVSALVIYLLDVHFFVSLWCFFAAAISLLLLCIFRR